MEKRKRDQVIKQQKEEEAQKKKSDLEIELQKRQQKLEQVRWGIMLPFHIYIWATHSHCKQERSKSQFLAHFLCPNANNLFRISPITLYYYLFDDICCIGTACGVCLCQLNPAPDNRNVCGALTLFNYWKCGELVSCCRLTLKRWTTKSGC